MTVYAFTRHQCAPHRPRLPGGGQALRGVGSEAPRLRLARDAMIEFEEDDLPSANSKAASEGSVSLPAHLMRRACLTRSTVLSSRDDLKKRRKAYACISLDETEFAGLDSTMSQSRTPSSSSSRGSKPPRLGHRSHHAATRSCRWRFSPASMC